MQDALTIFPDIDRWYVLRVTYQRELQAQQRLNELGVENFLPMRRVRRRNRQGRFCYVNEVAVHNYIFVHTTQSHISSLKMETMPYLRFMVVADGAQRRLMVVPDSDMRHFIAVAGSGNERIQYLDNEEAAIAQGDRVRVISGPFAGVEGRFVRLNNSRSRRVVVTLNGLISVATTTLLATQVERVE